MMEVVGGSLNGYFFKWYGVWKRLRISALDYWFEDMSVSVVAGDTHYAIQYTLLLVNEVLTAMRDRNTFY